MSATDHRLRFEKLEAEIYLQQLAQLYTVTFEGGNREVPIKLTLFGATTPISINIPCEVLKNCAARSIAEVRSKIHQLELEFARELGANGE